MPRFCQWDVKHKFLIENHTDNDLFVFWVILNGEIGIFII